MAWIVVTCVILLLIVLVQGWHLIQMARQLRREADGREEEPKG